MSAENLPFKVADLSLAAHGLRIVPRRLQNFLPLNERDYLAVGAGRTGPVTRRLEQAYHSLVRGEHHRSRAWLTPVLAGRAKVAATG